MFVFFKDMGSRPKKNPAWNLDNEKILVDFFKSEPILWEFKNTIKYKTMRAPLIAILVEQLGNVFTGNRNPLTDWIT